MLLLNQGGGHRVQYRPFRLELALPAESALGPNIADKFTDAESGWRARLIAAASRWPGERPPLSATTTITITTTTATTTIATTITTTTTAAATAAAAATTTTTTTTTTGELCVREFVPLTDGAPSCPAGSVHVSLLATPVVRSADADANKLIAKLAEKCVVVVLFVLLCAPPCNP